MVMEKKKITVRDLLRLMDYDERVEVFSEGDRLPECFKYLRSALELLENGDRWLDEPVVYVYRSVYDKIVIKID